MRLLFDLYATQPNRNYKYNGGSEYVRRVFIETLSRCDDSIEVFCTFNSNYVFEDYLTDLCLQNGVVLLDIAETGIERHIKSNNIDKVFLGLFQRYSKLELEDRVQVVLVCHDIRNLEVFPTRESLWNLSGVSRFKDKFQLLVKWLFLEPFLKLKVRSIKNTYKNMQKLAKRESTTIITVSEHTKYMILSQFPDIDKNRIRLLWAPELTYSVEMQQCHEIADEKYWLLVSADRWEKNALSIVDALTKINSARDKKIRLVLVGNLKDKNIYNRIKHQDWITLYDYVERGSLEWLYANCSVFLYPSFAEGFGYPPIEAMKYDKPIVASATSSIMEVCGHAPLYICPYSKLEIEARLRTLLDMDLGELALKSNCRYKEINERQHQDLESIIDIILSLQK